VKEGDPIPEIGKENKKQHESEGQCPLEERNSRSLLLKKLNGHLPSF
jgi:hypothetical protein